MSDFYKALRKTMHEQNMASKFTARWSAMTAWQRNTIKEPSHGE